MENLNLIIWAVIIALVGAILVGVYSDVVAEKTDLKTVTRESFDVVTARMAEGGNQINVTLGNFSLAYAYNTFAKERGWKIGESGCNIVVSGYGVVNSTIATVSFTENTDYKLWPRGIVQVFNTSAWKVNPLNTTYITYDYCGDEYVTSSWARTVLNLSPGFLVLVVFASIIGILYLIYRKSQ